MRGLHGLFFAVGLLVSSNPALAEPVETAPASAAAEVRLVVTGFSEDNAKAIRAHEAALQQRLSELPGSKGLRVLVEYGEGGTMIKVEETVSLPAEGLALAPLGMGIKALDHRRGQIIAIQVAAWVGMGPWRDAMVAGNAPLAEALGQREIFVQFVNSSGATLLLPYGPGYNARVQLASEVFVVTGKSAAPVTVYPRDGSVRPPRGADGAPSDSAPLYRWFGEAI